MLLSVVLRRTSGDCVVLVLGSVLKSTHSEKFHNFFYYNKNDGLNDKFESQVSHMSLSELASASRSLRYPLNKTHENYLFIISVLS